MRKECIFNKKRKKFGVDEFSMVVLQNFKIPQDQFSES